MTLVKCSILGLVGYDARLTRERSRVQSSEDVFLTQHQFHFILSISLGLPLYSVTCTSVYSSVVEYLPSKQVARVRFPVDAFLGYLFSIVAFVAQMVERKTLNLVVVGSIPIEGVFLLQLHPHSYFQCRWTLSQRY